MTDKTKANTNLCEAKTRSKFNLSGGSPIVVTLCDKVDSLRHTCLTLIIVAKYKIVSKSDKKVVNLKGLRFAETL